MTYTPSKPKSKDQRLVCTGMNWQQFKLIQNGFADHRGIRLFYYKGEVEILAVSPEHETFRETLAVLLGMYLAEKKIECVLTGAFTQEREGEVSAQADLSYFKHLFTINYPFLYAQSLDMSCLQDKEVCKIFC